MLEKEKKCQWDVEKVFDENKNKLGEDKAWARSATAKKQQAHFICMAHNLILMLCAQLEKQEGITDDKAVSAEPSAKAFPAESQPKQMD